MNTRLLFIKQAEAVTGRNRMTLRRWWESIPPKFPKPINIEGRNCWTEEAIQEWIDEKVSGGKSHERK